MQFIRNILIIGNKGEFQEELSKSLSTETSKIKIERISEKNELSQMLAGKNLNAIFMNLDRINDCLYIFRQLNMYVKKNPKMKLFFTSENFEVFQTFIKETAGNDWINVYPWPVNSSSLARTIINSIFNKKLSKQVVTKKNETINVDLEFIQVFVEATKHTLTEMGVTELSHHRPIFMDKMERPIEEGIASRIMISSKFFTGNIYIIFPTKTFLNFYESAVYETHTEINDENRDFAAELANIIYGQSKKVLAASGLNLDMVIPSIHDPSLINSELVIVIPFDASIGNLYIAVAPGII